MNCQFCASKIGILRLLTDREYCSDEHRRRGQAESRRTRTARFDYADEDLYDVYEILDPADEEKSQKLAKTQAGAAMVLAIVLIFVLAFSWMGNGPSGSPMPKPSLTANFGARSAAATVSSTAGGWLGSFKSLLPANAPLRLKDDFKTGLDKWVGGIGAAADWTFADGAIQPGRLRLWEPSVSLGNYKLEFEAQIQQKAVNWTYRSVNLDNFYANKIVMKRPGSLEIVRYAVLDGREHVRTKLPIPLISMPKSLYKIQMSVRGDQFTTLLNGQIIDTWSDSRLRKGGVGFFSEPGERSSIHWVNVNEERDGLLGQILSMGFFSNPALAMAPRF